MSDPIIAPAAPDAKKFEFKRVGYFLTLSITPDTVECKCEYKPNSAGAPMAYDDLQNYLKQAKIVEGIDNTAVSALLTAATSNQPVSDLLLARGIPMLPGEDGAIELAVEDALHSGTTTEIDEKANMDLRVVQQFYNAVPDQIIARIIPPGNGTSGRSVHGTIIEALPGKPMVPVLGTNVHISESGDTVYADSEGRVAIKGAEISVENKYIVKGNVDFKVGNIVFNGFVEIKGDVLDDFSVKATKGIKIQGNIGLSTIEAGGDIIFCGMSGQSKGVIRCGGSITANFINDTTVYCDGDILVENEIRNCHIHCLGSIKINKGVLAGGDYMALGGIESSTIGTVSSLHTHIAAGVHYRDQAELTRLFNELKTLISNFTNNKASADPKEFARCRAEITEQVQQVRTKAYPDRNPKINVKKTLYEMVNITLGNISEDNREERKGPLSIIENTVEGGLRFLNMTDLQVKSEDIERAFVQQNELQLKSSVG
jgi:uncharacterized protein